MDKHDHAEVRVHPASETHPGGTDGMVPHFHPRASVGVTKEQAINARYDATFHFTGRKPCERITGPRGGVREQVTRVRVSGACKTWSTRPDEFRLPVKYGLYESGAINHDNAHEFHSPADCPAGIAF